MVLALRLLYGGGLFHAYFPPTDNSWSRSGSNPILQAGVAWEETAVYEPSVMLEGSTWKMWYGGGWDHPGMGYATSSDGLTWTKYGSNPVYGQGGSSYANTAASSQVMKFGSTYWLFTSGGVSTTDARSTFRVATSSDGIAWTTQTSSITLPSGKTLWGNRAVWQEGATWFLLQEAGPTVWEIYLYTSTDGLTWSIANGGAALTTLQVHAGGMYGGPTLWRQGGTYHLWYHAAPGSGNTPTNIYHSTSTDKITWTTPTIALTHTGGGFEVDQVADPSIIIAGTTAYLYYDGDDNPAETGTILLATADAQ